MNFLYNGGKIFLIIYLIIINIYILKGKYFINKNDISIKFDRFEKNNLNHNNSIKVAYYCHANKFGGIARAIALLINYLSKEKYFEHYLITNSIKLDGEYYLPPTTKRISLFERNITLIEAIKYEKVDILIYNFFNIKQIEQLNKLTDIKIIYYDHSSFLFWIYRDIYNFQKTIYNTYKKCKYIVSLIPLESDYLFKKWGINSILIENLIIYEYDSVIPSELNLNNIIMMGRAYDPIKRYDLGIKAMNIIIKEIPDCKMNIISSPYNKLISLITSLNLGKNVEFSGYSQNPEIYLKNASLHILCSLSETYPLVLAEAKVFGIPSLICGLDYLTLAKGGTVIIYDDNPITIAEEAMKIMKNYTLRKQLGIEARNSMKSHKNELIIKKWIKLLLLVYRNDYLII